MLDFLTPTQFGLAIIGLWLGLFAIYLWYEKPWK